MSELVLAATAWTVTIPLKKSATVVKTIFLLISHMSKM
jgi:hypothetical protein